MFQNQQNSRFHSLRENGCFFIDLFMQSLTQHRNDQQCHSTADQRGNQLGPAEGGRQSLQHGLLQRAGSQQALGQHTADQQHRHREEAGRNFVFARFAIS